MGKTGVENAAAIGGGYSSGTGYYGIDVGIYGGTLEATAGKGAVAIGAGKGGDDHGFVFLGENINVSAGEDADHTEDVTATFAKTHDQAYVKTKVRDREPFDDVVDEINALPAGKDITTKDKAAIEAARKAYDELSADQKAKLPRKSMAKLEAADAIAAKATAKAEAKALKDKKAAEKKAAILRPSATCSATAP